MSYTSNTVRSRASESVETKAMMVRKRARRVVCLLAGAMVSVSVCPLVTTVPLIISPRRPTLNSDHGDHCPLELRCHTGTGPHLGHSTPSGWHQQTRQYFNISLLCISSFLSFLGTKYICTTKVYFCGGGHHGMIFILSAPCPGHVTLCCTC